MGEPHRLRIADIYRLNKERLEHDDPARALQRQTPAFDAAQAVLKTAVERLFADAESELAGLSGGSRKAKALRRLLKHREGLCIFLDKPFVPMCCFSHFLVEPPRELAGLFRRRIGWDDGAIRDPAGAVAFLMNRRCRSGEDVGTRASSVGKRWGSASFSRACPHAP